MAYVLRPSSEKQQDHPSAEEKIYTPQLTFLCGCILHRQGDELLIGWQDGPLRLGLFPFHFSVKLPPLGPSPEFLHSDLLKVKTLFQVVPKFLKICVDLPQNKTANF